MTKMALIIVGMVVAQAVAVALSYQLGLRVGATRERVYWGLPVGDGVTDDTAAIQRLVDCAGNGVLNLPAGRFKITGTINWGGR